MDESLLRQGLDLMLFGMLTVVLFLSLLVLATSALSALVRRFAPPAPVPAPAAAAPGSAVPANGPSPAVVAAIGAAIARHRQATSCHAASGHATPSHKERP
jgi:oxaloacetate decarboxylase gamma subunit